MLLAELPVQGSLHLGAPLLFLFPTWVRKEHLLWILFPYGQEGGKKKARRTEIDMSSAAYFFPPLLPRVSWMPVWSDRSVGSWSVTAFRLASFTNLGGARLALTKLLSLFSPRPTDWLIGPTPSCHHPVLPGWLPGEETAVGQKKLKSLWLFSPEQSWGCYLSNRKNSCLLASQYNQRGTRYYRTGYYTYLRFKFLSCSLIFHLHTFFFAYIWMTSRG